ncbi:carbohydrate ABC transporter permease [Defluviitalea saccharophila]|uniref:Carbohydrate ABC transporter permease n=1 Tax=Defluviitalea saccharophila TaxID=879970 RepID=A0ABZ2Y510_9FIRM
MKSMFKRVMFKERNRSIIYSIIGILIGAVFLFPLYWIVVSSLKTDVEIFAIPQTFFPTKLEWSNYTEQLFGKNNAFRAYINSTIIALSAMTTSMILGIPAAYGLARYKIPGKKAIITTFLVTQMLPSSLVLTPLFLTFSKLKLLNTYFAPIFSVATISIPFIVIILRPIFKTYPIEIEDAAKIDGCNRFSAFFRIVLPMSKPGIITVASFSFIHGWNDLVYSMTFNNKEIYRPMTATIYNLITEFGTQWNKVMAYGVLLVLPVVCMFVFLQKYIISGLTNGSVKG